MQDRGALNPSSRLFTTDWLYNDVMQIPASEELHIALLPNTVLWALATAGT